MHIHIYIYTFTLYVYNIVSFVTSKGVEIMKVSTDKTTFIGLF